MLRSLRRHVAAVWGLEVPPLRPGDVALGGPAPWALYLGVLAGGGEVRIWRDPPSEALAAQARAALAGTAGEAAFRWERAPAAVGPAARRLGPDDRALLEAFQPGELSYWLEPRRGPLYGVVDGDRLLSLAHSSRRTAEACECGVDTLAAARRRGLARACVAAWTGAVAGEGLEPIYSALRTNAVSLALARSCGFRPFAVGAHVGSASG